MPLNSHPGFVGNLCCGNNVVGLVGIGLTVQQRQIEQDDQSVKKGYGSFIHFCMYLVFLKLMLNDVDRCKYENYILIGFCILYICFYSLSVFFVTKQISTVENV